MSLADIMGAMRQPLFAEIGLLVFLALFVGVVASLFSRKNRAIFERARFLPLEAESSEAAQARAGRKRTTRHHG